MKIEFFCDICNGVIRNHMVCPACGHDYAGTSEYGSLSAMEIGEILECEECNAKFRLISKKNEKEEETPWGYDIWEWEIVEREN